MERQKEVAGKLSNPEDGDLFHDTDKALDAVGESHSSIQISRRLDDFITLKVVKDVIGDMLEDQKVRVTALQAYNKAEKAIRAAKKELQTYMGGSPAPERTNLLVSIPDQMSEQPALIKQQQTAHARNGSTSPYSKQRAPSPPSTQDRAANDAEPPPRISVATMLEWRNAKSYGIGRELPDQYLLDGIKGRDSVCCFDSRFLLQS